jgi:hypothetical protein
MTTTEKEIAFCDTSAMLTLIRTNGRNLVNCADRADWLLDRIDEAGGDGAAVARYRAELETLDMLVRASCRSIVQVYPL